MTNKHLLAATHDGIFHAAEVTACAVLRIVHDNITVIRTSDPRILTTVDILVAVGGVYNPPTHFDNDQDAPVRSANAPYQTSSNQPTPYSSAGLVWDTFGKCAIARVLSEDVAVEYQAYVTDDIIDMVWRDVDYSTFWDIDLWDNGLSSECASAHATGLESAIASYKPTQVSKQTLSDWEAGFARAVDVAVDILRRHILNAFSGRIADLVVGNSYRSAVLSGRVEDVN